MSTRRILVFGATGMLGHKLVQVLGKKGHEVCGTIRGSWDSVARYGIFDRDRIVESIDVLDDSCVNSALDAVRPDVVINAVGVIKQKRDALDPVATIAVNALFPHRLYEFAAAKRARVITFSTDCVFSGRKGEYTTEDFRDADDLYGRSKALGELEGPGAVTLRTSMIGRELNSSYGLVEWFLSTGDKKVNGFVNAIYTGLPTKKLAEVISDHVLPDDELNGVWQIASPRVNKYELLCLIRDRLGLDKEIARYENETIDRSLDGRRFSERTGFRSPSWPELVDDMFNDETPYDEWR